MRHCVTPAKVSLYLALIAWSFLPATKVRFVGVYVLGFSPIVAFMLGHALTGGAWNGIVVLGKSCGLGPASAKRSFALTRSIALAASSAVYSCVKISSSPLEMSDRSASVLVPLAYRTNISCTSVDGSVTGFPCRRLGSCSWTAIIMVVRPIRGAWRPGWTFWTISLIMSTWRVGRGGAVVGSFRVGIFALRGPRSRAGEAGG
jgi:hypothetical protein